MTDLHIHTLYSDGTDSCAELIKKIRAKGITTFAITDHDNIQGLKQMRQLVTDDIKFINGVEIAAIYEGTEIHLLGYGFDCLNESLNKMLQTAAAKRRERLFAFIEFIKKTYDIEFCKEELEWLKGLNIASRAHIAKLLIKRNMGANTPEAISYLNPFNAAQFKTDAAYAIQVFNEAGGYSSVAHPIEIMLKEKKDFAFIDALCLRLKAQGLSALEVYHSAQKLSDSIEFKKIAQQNNLLVSGGSDYHGGYKDVELGELCADSAVCENELSICAAIK